MLKKNNKGFTLVELLVVIAIIGILAVVAVPALFKNIEKGKVADLESDISAIRSAVLSYYTDNSEYPMNTTTTITGASGDSPSTTSRSTVVELSKNTIVEDAEENEQESDTTTKKNLSGTRELLSELEGLSFPYEGTYKLTKKDGITVAQSPETLYLTITTKGQDTIISEDGLKKLAQDLGLTKATSETGTQTTMAVTPASQGTGQKIIIPLINK